MNKQEVIERVKELVRTGELSNYEGPDEVEGYKLTEEKSWGGEEQGFRAGFVFKLDNGKETFLVQADGYYQSYEGFDYSYASVKEVEKYEKTVTDYREVK